MKQLTGRLVIVLVAGIIAVSSFFTYMVSINEYDYAKGELVDKSRVIAQLIMATRHFLAENQDKINRDSKNNFEFKGLNPAQGVLQTSKYFNRSRSYRIKQTSFPEMVRNPQNLPDQWELNSLTSFKNSPELKEIYGEVNGSEGKFFRYAIPLYIDETCLGCHGDTEGELDIAGFRKEGYKLGDLRGIVSIFVPMAGFDATIRGLVSKLLAGGSALGIFVALSLAVMLYVSLLKPAQKQLVKASQLAAAGRVAADVAHEINNPLGIISSRAELILQEENLSDQAVEDVEVIRHNASRIADYTRGLLSFARPFSGNPTKVDLNQTVSETVSFVEKQLRSKGIILQLELCEPVPRVWGQKSQFQQILLNLLANAGDALATGGTILVKTGRENNHQVFVVVQDNGSGIKAEDLNRVFDPFYSTKGDKGTGLGLSVCLSLARENGGKITVESNPEQGASFKLILPGSLE